MKGLRYIIPTLIILAAWLAGSNALLQRASLIPAHEYGFLHIGEGRNEEPELHRAVIDPSHCIETGIQTHSCGTNATLATKQTAGNSSNRVPVSAAQFTKNPQGKIPVTITTFKEVTFAAYHSRDFYVIGMRHLII